MMEVKPVSLKQTLKNKRYQEGCEFGRDRKGKTREWLWWVDC